MRFGALLLIAVVMAAQTAKEAAWQFYQQQRFGEAAALYEKHLTAHPEDRASALLLGLAWQQAGELGKAEAVFTQAKAPYFLGRVQYLRGKFDEALVSAARALKEGEEAGKVWQLRGRVEEERGNLELAVAHYRKAKAHGGMASALYKLGRYDEARQEAAKDKGDEGKRVREKLARVGPAVEGTAVLPKFVVEELPFVLANSPTAAKHLVSTMAGGLAAADFDGDGKVDLFFANGADPRTLKKTSAAQKNRLLLNRSGTWEERVLEGDGFSIGAAVGDYDRDGDLDVFVAGAGKNLLYSNSKGQLMPVEAGIRDEPFAVGAGWIDFDNDGWLDLFVVNYLGWTPANNKFCGDAVRVYCHPKEFAPLANRLYRNKRDGTFEDVSARSGIGAHLGKGMSLAVADFDADGWMDVFVTNDNMPNFLFRNKGDGTFEEMGLTAGAAFSESGKPVSAMGVSAGDLDGDGKVDVVFTALVRETFPFLKNLGEWRFQDVTYPSKLGAMTMTKSGWGVVMGDFNNDGWLDLLTANSHVTDNVAQISNEVYEEEATVFVQMKGRFAGASAVTPKGAWRGIVMADFDGDGKLDAALTRLGGKAVLLWNVSEISPAKTGKTPVVTTCGYASSCAGPVLLRGDSGRPSGQSLPSHR